MITKLESKFTGIGEVKGFEFEKVKESETAYIYKVDNGFNKYHYEVFVRKSSPICIDFEKKVYSDVDFKESYPKSNHFGVWAWSFIELDDAINRFNAS